MQQLQTPQPVPDTAPRPTPDTIPPPGPDVVPTPLPITPEPVPPEIIEPPLPGEHRPIREPGPPPPPSRAVVYDMMDHQTGGFRQQQSYGGSLSFNCMLIDVVAPHVSLSSPMLAQPLALASLHAQRRRSQAPRRFVKLNRETNYPKTNSQMPVRSRECHGSPSGPLNCQATLSLVEMAVATAGELMNEPDRLPIEPNPQRDLLRVSPGATETSVPAEPPKVNPEVDDSEKLDQLRRNPASQGSNYGFGTPAEGFGPKRHRADKPKRP